MRHILFATLLGFFPNLPGTLPAEDRKPNVIILFTDDQGSVDMGAYGAEDLETPAMDALAESGVRFTQFYAAAPVCSPSRAGLLTGRYPVRAGVPFECAFHERPGRNAGGTGDDRRNDESGGLRHRPHRKMAPRLHSRNDAERPGVRLFVRPHGRLYRQLLALFLLAGTEPPRPPPERRRDLRGREVSSPTSWWTRPRNSSTGHRDKPFFLYFAMNMPHYPYQGDAEVAGALQRSPLPAQSLRGLPLHVGRADRKASREGSTNSGLREETIVIFQSDHGHSTEERAHFGGGSAGRTAVPSSASSKAASAFPRSSLGREKSPKAKCAAQLGHGCDWLPTIAELAGVPLLEKDIDGKSLAGGDPIGGREIAARGRPLAGGQRSEEFAVGGEIGGWKLIGNPERHLEEGPAPQRGAFPFEPRRGYHRDEGFLQSQPGCRGEAQGTARNMGRMG